MELTTFILSVPFTLQLDSFQVGVTDSTYLVKNGIKMDDTESFSPFLSTALKSYTVSEVTGSKFCVDSYLTGLYFGVQKLYGMSDDELEGVGL